MVNEASQYPWSSYRLYLQFDSTDDLVDCKFLLSMLSPSPTEAISDFVKLSSRIDEDAFIELLTGEEVDLTVRENNAKAFINKFL